MSGETKLVDETTYSSVIRLWVKDVRDRSNQQPSLEVSQLSSESEVRGHITLYIYNIIQFQYTG